MTPFTLFETSVVGSLPRPQWVQDVVLEDQGGSLSAEAQQALSDKAVSSAIGLQEAAGVDVISDGEWRRRGYVEFMAQRVSGFVPVQGEPRSYRVVSRLERHQPFLLDDARFLVEHAEGRTKVTLPSPYHVANRNRIEFDSGVYADRESFLADITDIIEAEVADLAGSGVDVIQFDDPRMLGVTLRSPNAGPFPHSRGDLEYEMGLALGSLARATARAAGIRTAVHVCRGNADRKVFGTGGYETLMPYLHEIPCDQVLMEFAVPEAGELSVLKDFPKDKLLGLGVTDVRSPEIAGVEAIVSRVTEALAYVDPDRVTLNPDCGFAPTMTNPIPLDEAYQKLRVQSAAARELRRRFG